MLDPKAAKHNRSGKSVKEGQIWVYVCDGRPYGGPPPSGAAYFFSPDRKGEHPRTHLSDVTGIMQDDAYSGFKKLYEPDPVTGKSRIGEAACPAHLRRDFDDLWKSTSSAVAEEALKQIGELYDIERALKG